MLDGSSDLGKIKFDVSADVATPRIRRASSKSHSSVLISSPQPAPHLSVCRRATASAEELNTLHMSELIKVKQWSVYLLFCMFVATLNF